MEKIMVYDNINLKNVNEDKNKQQKNRYEKALTKLNEDEYNLNADEFKQIVMENVFPDISELFEVFGTETFIIPHDKDNEKFVTDKNIQHIHIYIKTTEHRNIIYKKINNVKKITKNEFIKQIKNLNEIELTFTNTKKQKLEERLKMKKTLLHYNTINVLNKDIASKIQGAVLVKDDGTEVVVGDRISGYSPRELAKLKSGEQTRLPLEIEYILNLVDLETEERQNLVKKLKEEFKNDIEIITNNNKILKFKLKNYTIQNNILKVYKLTNAHLKVLKFLNSNNVNVINMPQKKQQVFNSVKRLEEDLKDINKYIVKPNFYSFEDIYNFIHRGDKKQEVKTEQQTTEQVTEQQEKVTTEREKVVNIEEVTDEELRNELETIENKIKSIKEDKYIDDDLKKEIIKRLQTKKTTLYNEFLERQEQQKIEEINKLKKELEEKNNEIENLLNENEQLKTENNELKQEIEKLNNELSEKNNLIKMLTNENKVLQNNISELGNELKKLDSEIKEKINENTYLKQQIDNLNKKINKITKDNEKLQKQINELKQKIKENNNKFKAEYNKLKSEKEQKDNVITELKNKIKELEELNNKLQDKNEEMKNILFVTVDVLDELRISLNEEEQQKIQSLLSKFNLDI